MLLGVVAALVCVLLLVVIEYHLTAPNAETLIDRQTRLFFFGVLPLGLLSLGALVYGITWSVQQRRYRDDK